MNESAAKRMTRAQIMSELSERTGLSKKELTSTFEALRDLIKRELSSQGPGEFVIPDMLKLRVRELPAKEERQEIDPFTKQMRTLPAKPAELRVKATPLKKLKDLVSQDSASGV